MRINYLFRRIYIAFLILLLCGCQNSAAQTVNATFKDYVDNSYDYFSYVSQAPQIYWSGFTRTANRGNTWQVLTLSKTGEKREPLTIGSPVFVNAELGFLYGPDDAGIWKTTDGGNIWTKILPGSCYEVYTDQKNRVIAHMIDKGVDYFYSSSDSGKTWKTVRNLKFPGEESFPTGITFLENGIVLCSFSTLALPSRTSSTVGIAESKDVGLNWEVKYQKTGQFDEIWRKLIFYDTRHGWALPRTKTSGWWDYFYYTADGGKTWKKIRTPKDAHFDEIIPLTEKNALMLSWSGFITAKRYVYFNSGNKVTHKALDCGELEKIFNEYKESIEKSPTGIMLRENYYSKKLIGYSDPKMSENPCR